MQVVDMMKLYPCVVQTIRHITLQSFTLMVSGLADLRRLEWVAARFVVR